VRGAGSRLWDSDGKEYLDLYTNYGVNILGHAHPKVNAAIKEQVDRLSNCHSSFYNDARAEFLATLAAALPADRVVRDASELLIYESDALVLTQILGPTAVTTYSVTMRVFLVVPALANFVLAPLWPAYGEAISRGDVHWVRQTLRRAIRGGLLLTVPGAAVLALVARPFIAAWAGVESPYLLICAAAIWVIVMTLGAVIAAFLNGARVIRAQIVAAVTMMIANLGLSIVFTHWLGVSGVIWGSIAAEGAVVVVLLVVVVPSVVSRLESRQPLPS